MPYAFSRMSDSVMRDGMRECLGEGEGDVVDGGLEEDAPGGGRGGSRRFGQDGIVCL